VKMGPGTLYAYLAKLETAGLVEALPTQDRSNVDILNHPSPLLIPIAGRIDHFRTPCFSSSE
jgi:hypothetical protein